MCAHLLAVEDQCGQMPCRTRSTAGYPRKITNPNIRRTTGRDISSLADCADATTSVRARRRRELALADSEVRTRAHTAPARGERAERAPSSGGESQGGRGGK